MSKTLEDQPVKPDRRHLKGYGSPNNSPEQKHAWQSAGGRERARRGTGHQWNTVQARANGLRAYLQQLSSGIVFGSRKVERVPITGSERVATGRELSTWEGESEDD